MILRSFLKLSLNILVRANHKLKSFVSSVVKENESK